MKNSKKKKKKKKKKTINAYLISEIFKQPHTNFNYYENEKEHFNENETDSYRKRDLSMND